MLWLCSWLVNFLVFIWCSFTKETFIIVTVIIRIPGKNMISKGRDQHTTYTTNRSVPISPRWYRFQWFLRSDVHSLYFSWPQFMNHDNHELKNIYFSIMGARIWNVWSENYIFYLCEPVGSGPWTYQNKVAIYRILYSAYFILHISVCILYEARNKILNVWKVQSLLVLWQLWFSKVQLLWCAFSTPDSRMKNHKLFPARVLKLFEIFLYY